MAQNDSHENNLDTYLTFIDCSNKCVSFDHFIFLPSHLSFIRSTKVSQDFELHFCSTFICE